MTRLRPRPVDPPSRILVPFYLEESAQGLTLGLYLYVYGKFLVDAAPPGFADQFFSWLTFWILVLEPVTGYVADLRGRALSLRTSFLLRSGFFALMFCSWLATLHSEIFTLATFAAGPIFALSYTLRSGALDAWLHDSLDSVGYASAYTRIYARGNRYLWWCFIGGALVGVYLQDLEYTGTAQVANNLGHVHIAFLLGAFISLVAYFLLSVAMTEPASAVGHGNAGGGVGSGARSVAHSLRYIFQRKGFLVIGMAAGGAMVLVDGSDYLWRPFFERLRDASDGDDGIVSKWVALLLFAGATNAGNLCVSGFLTYYRRRNGTEAGHRIRAWVAAGCFPCGGVRGSHRGSGPRRGSYGAVYRGAAFHSVS